MKYKVYTLYNYRKIPQIKKYLSDEEIRSIQVVGSVLPFKVNNYVIDELIDWTDIPNSPIFHLTFPQKGMLSTEHFELIDDALKRNKSNGELEKLINDIRLSLNPHPSGQEKNIPELNGKELLGIQHKYRETVLFFPSNCQACHAYCTFCFRWPQFVGVDKLKFAMQETNILVDYVKQHTEVSDVLFTGGDPMIMSYNNLSNYIEPLINNQIQHLQNIRIGTKSLSYWPYRYTTDSDADQVLRLFEKVVKHGYHLSLMAHFSHPKELKTEAVRNAIRRILNTGVTIRTQSPIMKHINDQPEIWTEMWKEQVKLGCIPYYMFVARDTGAQDYFAITLSKAWEIFRKAYRKVSGITRTVRGPVMSADPGKVQILGVSNINGQKVFVLRFIQARNPELVGRPFFAKYNHHAQWLTDLVPTFDFNIPHNGDTVFNYNKSDIIYN